MKRTSFFCFLAMLGAVFAPLTVAGQVNPEVAPSPQAGPFKWEGYAGFAYTSLNQVNQSRYGLVGGKGLVMRDWGKYFGLTGSVDYYRAPLSSKLPGNPGDPSVYTFMAGPELHANIYENLDGIVFAEVGVEHTGGEGMIPSTSFAGGFGGGIKYNINDRFAVRITGDRVGASFSLNNNTSLLGNSTHRTWNARATIGVVYRF